eukprot:CAMPEP_0184492790 /NCGR_PEP_ID=MMETSP0113_2-20130426/24275_1 /TAXON_ID=91329 /ORGANISM="Norrisiella sphaerica, Strain BC52" /LENGTH=110 /DNA_ID=CAMNT_0026877783 /DNA_START=462 /DNA_END=794 /DNA_ORIENTATION=+
MESSALQRGMVDTIEHATVQRGPSSVGMRMVEDDERNVGRERGLTLDLSDLKNRQEVGDTQRIGSPRHLRSFSNSTVRDPLHDRTCIELQAGLFAFSPLLLKPPGFTARP